MVTKNKDYYEKHLARNKMITVHVLIQIVAKFIGFLSFTLDKYSGMNFETDFPFLKDEFEFSSFRKKLILRIEKHLDIEFPDNLLKAMTKMNDLVEILSSTNENLKIREAEELDIDPAMFEKKVMNPVAEKVVGFLNTTPTDFFDIIYNS